MSTDLILLSIKSENLYQIENILLNKKIYFKDLNYINGIIYFKIKSKDYERLSLILKDIKIEKHYGTSGITHFIKKHFILILSFIFVYILLVILSNVIFDIEIVTQNNELKRIISLYLKDENIEKYKFVKDNATLDKVKKKILEENKDTLEWIEIERVGTKYIVNLTERIVTKELDDSTPKNIVASKDAMIMYIVTKKGTRIKEMNEIVKKGEVIISGLIKKDEEIVEKVKAQGEVYGEVWYKVTTTVPFKHSSYEKTGKKITHIYLDIFGKKLTLMGKYDTKNSMNETKVLIDKPYLFFKVMKETKSLYKYETHNLTENEAYIEALKRSERSISDKLNEEEYIIDKKVLKKNIYSSKIEIEVFYRVYESIGIEEDIPNEPVETLEGE